MRSQHKSGLKIFFISLFFSFLLGYTVYHLLQLVNSFYEEMLAASLIGVFAFLSRRKFSVILMGGIVGMVGWLIGLRLSCFIAQKYGISFGAWFVTSLALFLMLSVRRLKKGKYFKSFLMLILGIFLGFVIEIVQMLPAFLPVFKFQDFQAFAVISAAILIIPLANVLSRDREEKHEI